MPKLSSCGFLEESTAEIPSPNAKTNGDDTGPLLTEPASKAMGTKLAGATNIKIKIIT